MVRLKVGSTAATPKRIRYFNSTMVRLKGPVWMDIDYGKTHFNSTMVRLKDRRKAG